MKTRRLTLLIVAALLATVGGVGIQAYLGPRQSQKAAATHDTLERIRATGKIVVGQRHDAVPFSYYDDGRDEVIGYAQDLAQKVVEAVKSELKLPALKVEYVKITPGNRFSAITEGGVDVECGTTAHTAEREQLVDFSVSFFVGRMRLMTRKDYGIRDFADLAGKTVVTTAATTNLAALTRMNDEKKMGMNIVVKADHHEAFLALENKQAVAFLMDDVLLNGERIRAIRWGDWIITGTPQAREAYACTLRKGDTAFKRVVDQALAAAMSSGEAEKIYNKWFMSPIPPLGINLNFPMSSELAELFRSPNDRIADNPN